MIVALLVLAVTAAYIGLSWRSVMRAKPEPPPAHERPPGPPREAMLTSFIGKVVALDQLRAPVSQRLCVIFSVRERRNEPNHQGISSRTSGVVFLLDDGARHALVDPTGATFELHHETLTGSEFVEVDEARVEHGDIIEVSGFATEELDPQPHAQVGYRDAAPTRLCFRWSRHHAMTITGEPR